MLNLTPKTHEPTRIQKVQIIIEHLNERIAALYKDTDPSTQDVVSINVKYLLDELNFQTLKLEVLRRPPIVPK